MDPSDRQNRQLGAQQSKTGAGAMRRQLATAQKRHASTDAHPHLNCTWKEKSEHDLNEAALHGTYFTVRKLLKEGVDVNALCKTVDGLRTAMMQAAECSTACCKTKLFCAFKETTALSSLN